MQTLNQLPSPFGLHCTHAEMHAAYNNNKLKTVVGQLSFGRQQHKQLTSCQRRETLTLACSTKLFMLPSSLTSIDPTLCDSYNATAMMKTKTVG